MGRDETRRWADAEEGAPKVVWGQPDYVEHLVGVHSQAEGEVEVEVEDTGRIEVEVELVSAVEDGHGVGVSVDDTMTPR